MRGSGRGLFESPRWSRLRSAPLFFQVASVKTKHQDNIAIQVSSMHVICDVVVFYSTCVVGGAGSREEVVGRSSGGNENRSCVLNGRRRSSGRGRGGAASNCWLSKTGLLRIAGYHKRGCLESPAIISGSA